MLLGEGVQLLEVAYQALHHVCTATVRHGWLALDFAVALPILSFNRISGAFGYSNLCIDDSACDAVALRLVVILRGELRRARSR